MCDVVAFIVEWLLLLHGTGVVEWPQPVRFGAEPFWPDRPPSIAELKELLGTLRLTDWLQTYGRAIVGTKVPS